MSTVALNSYGCDMLQHDNSAESDINGLPGALRL
jgi:hypothetical protein